MIRIFYVMLVLLLSPLDYLEASPVLIDIEQMQDLITSVPNLTIVDARSAKYYNGVRIKGALWLPCEALTEEIEARLPDRNSPVVVYCWSRQCPASGYLAERLSDLGYVNLYEYPEGLKEWITKGLPTEKDH